jgi:hypothetical protein
MKVVEPHKELSLSGLECVLGLVNFQRLRMLVSSISAEFILRLRFGESSLGRVGASDFLRARFSGVALILIE